VTKEELRSITTYNRMISVECERVVSSAKNLIIADPVEAY
jgi:hypothetical protein